MTDIILEFKKSAPGHDKIGTSLIKEVMTSIIKPLTFIYALFMNTGIISSDLKMVKVIPLFKTTDPKSFQNIIQFKYCHVLEKLFIKEFGNT